ncbi:uncharacterized protein Z518_01583 [Rhinocladiella mackenziei CBS 650.93]|uniref:5'-3' DNA helicase ZGRF1-like N-terminal domain-containing protein n=1 Tax=Rhinocladiella mackenziei CBS 650.93 TaxID=1442369 RepID=A0A0D2JM40_9EURO|nr:uncharacterized protein Z518_01583 [Rhinocladiella mackenziei CBS 650.93]KIX10500.1 hypothetical protein Z518_01583 [Rhinocladiella mackenziei CBS 650.93]
MPTPTSTHRGALNLTVVPTQNTAPVHEFRCLYTRDLYKKAKKWHDGSLRFHTFNRRVMVYDDAKNYIGDLHYRQEEEFAEGVEIQLDRGVKVEVGERLGETQTDLAPILERPRPEKVVAQARQATGLNARPSSTGPSARPKSLLEVLGPSQGRLGHSRLSLQSPYEQRQASSRIKQAEPLPKRRRLSGDKENRSGIVMEPMRPRLPQPARPNQNKSAALSSHQTDAPIEFHEGFDISSAEELRQRRVKVVRPASLSVNGPKKSREERQATKKLTSELPKARQNSTSAYEDGPTGIALDAHENPAKPKSNKTKATVANARSTKIHTARLLLNQQKVRCKLTCLLPLSKDQISRRRSNNSDEVSLGRDSTGNAAVRDQAGSPLNRYGDKSSHDKEPSQLILLPSPSPKNSPGGDPSEGRNIFPSPLFIPDENAGPKSPSPRPILTQDDFLFPDFEDNRKPERSPIAEQVGSKTGFIAEENTQTNSCSLLDPNSPHPVPRQDNYPRLPALRTNPRTFRRVFSEVDVLEDEDFIAIPEAVGVQSREPLEVLENLASRRSSVKSKSPSRFRRCASDTAVLDKGNNDMRESNIQERSKEETGPWTAEEAFLLFDWWPTDLEKPGLWASAVQELAPQAAVSGAGRGFSTTITTARQFLRDDVNVL